MEFYRYLSAVSQDGGQPGEQGGELLLPHHRQQQDDRCRAQRQLGQVSVSVRKDCQIRSVPNSVPGSGSLTLIAVKNNKITVLGSEQDVDPEPNALS